MPSGYLVAAAHLTAGEVASRGWFHVNDAGEVRRLPDRWQVPADALVAVSNDGRALAWVEPDGTVWCVGASCALPAPGPSAQRVDAGGADQGSDTKDARDGGAAQALAKMERRGEAVRVLSGAEPAVAPLFVGVAAFVIVQATGALVRVAAEGVHVVWAGASSKLSDLTADPERLRVAAVVAGEALAVVDVAGRRGHIAYHATARGTRLFGPRFARDGALLVRERQRSRTRLLRIPATGGDAESRPLPRGRLRAFEILPDGRLALGLMRRGDGSMVGEVWLAAPAAQSKAQDAGTVPLRRLATFARTLPWAQTTCDGALWLVEEDGRTARLVRLDPRDGARRVLSPSALRLLGSERAVVGCAAR